MIIINQKGFNAIDLFSGCGGLSLGLSEAGFNIVLANEINKDAATTYQHNLVKKKGHDCNIIVKDITKVSNDFIKKTIGNKEIHLVAAGPPCQGFSLAGKRDINDPRNKLFKELLRVVKVVNPPVFLMENVKGILTMNEGKVIKEIESQFRCLGYHISTKILKASDFGVPQDRERVFIIGTKKPVENIHPNSKNIYVTAGEALSDLDFLHTGKASKIYLKKAETDYQRSMRSVNGPLHNHESANHSARVIERFSNLKEGQTAEDLPKDIKTKKRSLYRLDPKKQSRTIVTLPDDYVHYSKDRILTVREMARLQSFPDWFEFLGPKSTGGPRRKFDVPQYSQVGNAVPPLLAKAVGESLLNYLKKYHS